MKIHIDDLSPARARSVLAGLAISVLAAAGLGAAGCGGTTITPELRDARAAVAEAQSSSAARLKPDDLRVAVRTLSQAESAPEASSQQADLAYLANRQAQIAMTEARQVELEQQLESDQARYRARLEAIARARGERIEVTEGRLAEQRRTLTEREQMLAEQEQQLAEQGAAVAQTQAALDAERQAREDAERRAEESMVRLRELAAVRQERDEIVITLSGEVLFESDRAALLDTARERLLAVADALRSEPEQSVVIEGHTDSRGSDVYNQHLSRQRAESVLAFLVGEGVPAARLQAVGIGESRPIASNDDPEGRAVNRRVELHLRPVVPPR